MKGVTVIAHPLVQHNLARLRDRRTQPQEFRRLLGEPGGEASHRTNAASCSGQFATG